MVLCPIFKEQVKKLDLSQYLLIEILFVTMTIPNCAVIVQAGITQVSEIFYTGILGGA